MKTKILAGVVLMTIATAGTLTYAASNTNGSGVLKKTLNNMHLSGSGGMMGKHRGMQGAGDKMGGFGKMGIGVMSELSDAEKAKLKTMTDTEKQAFFEAKMTANKALRDSKEAVIDKLINGETLSDTEKATLETIKTERAAQKTERLAREKEMTEMKAIHEKVKAGTALTTDEQAKLDAFKSKMSPGKKEGGRGSRGGDMMRGIGR